MASALSGYLIKAAAWFTTYVGERSFGHVLGLIDSRLVLGVQVSNYVGTWPIVCQLPFTIF